MVSIAQLVRASDCGPEGRGFDSHYPPHEKIILIYKTLLVLRSVFILYQLYIVFLLLKLRQIAYLSLTMFYLNAIIKTVHNGGKMFNEL